MSDNPSSARTSVGAQSADDPFAISSMRKVPLDLEARVRVLEEALNLSADALAMVHTAASTYIVATYEDVATPEQRDDLDTAAKAARVVERSARKALSGEEG